MHTRRIADTGWRTIRQQEQARKRDAALRLPSRWSSVQPPIAWMRIDGGHTLNAAPLITGVSYDSNGSATCGAVTPGEVDPNTGVETTAPTGTFADGFGYGTLAIGGGQYRRVIVVNLSNFIASSLLTNTVWVARMRPATVGGAVTQCWEALIA